MSNFWGAVHNTPICSTTQVKLPENLRRGQDTRNITAICPMTQGKLPENLRRGCTGWHHSRHHLWPLPTLRGSHYYYKEHPVIVGLTHTVTARIPLTVITKVPYPVIARSWAMSKQSGGLLQRTACGSRNGSERRGNLYIHYTGKSAYTGIYLIFSKNILNFLPRNNLLRQSVPVFFIYPCKFSLHG